MRHTLSCGARLGWGKVQQDGRRHFELGQDIGIPCESPKTQEIACAFGRIAALERVVQGALNPLTFGAQLLDHLIDSAGIE